MLSCYEWLHPNLRPLPVITNVSGGGHGGGWRVSEYTQQVPRRRKPALLSIDRGDVVELAIDVGALNVVGASGAFGGGALGGGAMCIGLTYLTSYVGMGVATVECGGVCACPSAQLDGLRPAHRVSLFRTDELRASVAGITAAARPHAPHHIHTDGVPSSSHDACIVRIAHIGRPAEADAPVQTAVSARESLYPCRGATMREGRGQPTQRRRSMVDKRRQPSPDQ
jgi:hypothetical protein